MWLEARIRAFGAVARQRSFSRAAEELVVTQPSISKHVSQLERELGTRLLERTPRGAELTPAGALLAEYVLRAHALLAQGERAVRSFVAGEGGILSLAASGNPGNYVVPPVLARFRELHPDVEIAYEIGNSHEVEHAVREHRVELGIVGGASSIEELESEPLLEDEIVLVGAPDLGGRRLTSRQLEQLTWIFREEGSATRGIADEARRQLGVTIRKRLELPSWEAIKTAVAAGGSVGTCSRYAIQLELRAGTLVELDVPRWRVRRLMSSVRARGVPLSPPAERFLDLLRASIDDGG
jgi:DNA-binding transcriptional LysR family regulator